MNSKVLILGAFLGLTAVILGAFGAHGLKELVLPEQLVTFETGVRYQMYHALLLLFLGSSSVVNAKTKQIIFYLVLIGILLFSGSIYGLATNNLTAFNFTTIGFITPIGGFLLIVSWLLLLIKFLKNRADISKN
ncbi:Uncharacterized membrane protein YgdD, TMEM256/DUF423 family [Bizionia echini]|uniref:Uncharacterized membrane protein YgdD, TMEM256/DUF423 family n=1 Tax=Bizionia echini TaxID=649333 RepID=A0A1I4YVP8_9FLAO|nr:DUF423 domain-containing protein [Bizionia echini]SFN42095.1 Uncharacterized membrane protein YgdD, TMEM256/DUF423 family [Bizionia echini]|tara:strand:- start:3 stop:404 length:402 start_codon:yes stop_codon:yes gene_type:complete